MPELPDVTVYIEHLDRLLRGQRLERVRVIGPNLLRTVDPPVESAAGREVVSVRRIGKRIVLGMEGDLFLVVHLMIAGRLHWKERGAALTRRTGLLALDFPHGTLTLTEVATRKRVSLHVVAGEAALRELDPGGLEVLEAPLPAFRERLLAADHTLKRALTDPHAFSGIGHAYSDEILHAARLSPLQRTVNLSDGEIERLWRAVQSTLAAWTDRLRQESAATFPEHVTAFRPGMAVHGRWQKPCPVCGAPVQRIVYADTETNYCARCQTGGRLLADRSLSRLLRGDWPRTLEELEELRRPG